jgi:hypothetical protein
VKTGIGLARQATKNMERVERPIPTCSSCVFLQVISDVMPGNNAKIGGTWTSGQMLVVAQRVGFQILNVSLQAHSLPNPEPSNDLFYFLGLEGQRGRYIGAIPTDLFIYLFILPSDRNCQGFRKRL